MVKRKESESPFAIYCWFVQVVIVLSLTGVVIWLSTKPHIPKFTINNVYLPQMSNRNVSKAQQNGSTIRNNSLVVVVDITNPNNGMTICYLDIVMSLHHNGLLIANKSLGTFCHGHKKSVTKQVLIGVDHQQLQRADNGGQGLRLTIETMIKYHILKWKTKIHHICSEWFVIIGIKGNVTKNIYLHKIR
ncbi:protein NDR1-like [Rutidosis leptorrhynchoides]|uniref:protein NDR1-like n=1 Tax=Rutidosis leptorrhynchoides TaxID=125765 RepID=UPI003A98F8A3